MSPTVKLRDITDALEVVFDEMPAFLDLTTCKVESVHSELLSLAEELEDDEEPDLPEWQRDEWMMARRIVFSRHDFRKLPTKYDIHEWEIMRDFADSVRDPKIREDIQRAIQGRGAFRVFKDSVHRYHIQEAWYAFRTDALRQIAIDWCEENDINWQE